VKLRILVVLGLVLCAACEKASDIPAIQAELNGVATGYKQRFDDLEQRGKRMFEQLNKLSPKKLGFNDASTLSARANRRVLQLKELPARVQNDAAAALKANKPEQLRELARQFKPITPPPGQQEDKPTDLQLELQRVLDSFSGNMEDSYTEVVAAYEAIDNWMANAPEIPDVAAAPTTPPSTPSAPPDQPTATP
jgi:hypothetical protein